MDCHYFYREAKDVRISPSQGKLALFDSGAQNIHSVREIFGSDKRLTLTILYTRMSKIDPHNLPHEHLSAYHYSLKYCYSDYIAKKKLEVEVTNKDKGDVALEESVDTSDLTSDVTSDSSSSSENSETDGDNEGDTTTEVRSRRSLQQTVFVPPLYI